MRAAFEEDDVDVLGEDGVLASARGAILERAAEITTAYCRRHMVTLEGLLDLLTSVHREVLGIANGTRAHAHAPPRAPAVSVKKSVQDSFIVCLEDGAKLKTLKRYLRTRYGLTPETYRLKWDLPSDYPMVAPEYARRRSVLAKKIGLGRNSVGRPPARKGKRRT